MFDKYADFALFFHAVREEAGGTTGTGAAFHVVTHHTNGDVYFVLDFRLRRRWNTGAGSAGAAD